ncbi:MAG TPA: hypothetical protein VIM61_09105 [Chthoniobacterales bacterium]|jgi:hypothetical protein
MSDLTDADKKSFIDKIIASLGSNAAALTAAGFDPATRITNLKNGVTSVTNDEGLVAQLDVALASAVATRRTDLENNYALASATVNLVEGVLGKDAPLVRDLRQIRSGFSQEAKPVPAVK